MNKKGTSGFTLIELAIVIVIIGLLVGGVLQGQELIKQAKVRNQIAQLSDVNRAVLTFRLKYNELPGDMPNAAQYWGDLGPCYDTDRTGDTATCAGNGDKIIGMTYGPSVDPIVERLFFWHHLSNAQLIKQSFGGALADGSDEDFNHGHYELGALQSKVDDSAWLGSMNRDIYIIESFRKPMRHMLILGGDQGEDMTLIGKIIKPEMAYSLDAKMDDGMPDSGNIVASGDSSVSNFYAGSTACRAGTSPETYQVSSTTNLCALDIGMDY